MDRHIALALGVLLVAGLPSQIAAAPPRPGTEGNGLNESEAATLWSRDDDQYVTNAAYERTYGESRSAVHTVANATDLTFAEPPATAATWTRNDHADYTPGDVDTSVYPRGVDPVDGAYLADAHATIFGAHPATWVHAGPTGPTLYVRPNGTLRGAVDYRVRVPDDDDTGNRTVSWRLRDHEIETVRVLADGAVVATATGSHRPAVRYRLPSDAERLTLEAEVRVELERTTTIRRRQNASASPNGTDTGPPADTPEPDWTVVDRDTDTVTETLTASDSRDVTVYDLEAWLRYVRRPDGGVGLAAFRSAPWQGLSVGSADHRVRGVWRFYTARETEWDRVTVATAEGTTTRPSDALPVYVHAYPSELAPRVADPGGPLELTRVWGKQRDSPAGTLGEGVTVEVVERPYQASYGLALRTRDRAIDPSTVTVHGIVRGTTADVTTPRATRERELRDASLSITVLERTSDGAVLQLHLTDGETGEPIPLENLSPRRSPLADTDRTGYITVAGETVRTGPNGTATVTVTEPGIYTARYRPSSWLRADPAYASTTATARWHPLHTVDSWLRLLTTTLQWAIPFALALYAGRRLGRIVRAGEVRR